MSSHGNCQSHNSDFFLSKRTHPHDPEDTENTVSEDADNMAKSYGAFGRICSRQTSPFSTVDSVVNFGIIHEATDDDSDTEPAILTTQ